MVKRVAQIPSVATLSSIADPNVRRFLSAMKDRIEALEKPVSEVGESIKRPSVQDMIDADVPNAENIK
jgi:hypothetical protein